MALFELVSDPVLSLAVAKKLCDLTDDDVATLAVNSVTDKFRRFMNRSKLARSGTAPTYDTVQEWICGKGDAVLWLRGGPVTADASNDVTVELFDGPTVVGSWTYSDEDVRVIDDGQGDGIARIALPSCVEFSEVPNLRATYAAGWIAIPGDIIQAALEQMRADQRRGRGEAGASNVSRSGDSVSWETGGLLKSVADALRPYRCDW